MTDPTSTVSVVLSATFSAFVIALAEKDSAHFLYYAAVIIVFIGLVLSLTFAWEIHEFRCSILTVRQGVLHFLMALVFGGIISSGGTAVILFFNLIMPVTSTGFRLISFGTTILLGLLLLITTLIWIALRFFPKHHIRADQCYAVLRHIDREQVLGKYNFVLGATASEIRRESHILDYLARYQPELVKRRFWSGYTLPNHHLAEVAVEKDSLDNFSSGQEDRTREQELADIANKIWQAGENSAWRKEGRKVQAIQFKDVFGNKLDELFNRGKGIKSYGSEGPRFVTLVIKGAPGAGKSTLALQMSVTLARQGNMCLYYSLEEEREALLQNAQNFGWKDPSLPVPSRNPDTIYYRGVQRVSSHVDTTTDAATSQEPSREGVVLVSSLGGRAMSLEGRKRRLHKAWGRKHASGQPLPEVACSVVIDSLEGFANVGLEQRSTSGVSRDEVLGLKDFFRDRCRLLIILVEDDNTGTPGYVDFVADVVIQLGRKVEAGYVTDLPCEG